MTTMTVQDIIKEVYDETHENAHDGAEYYTENIIKARNELVPLLASIPEADRTAINAFMQDYLQERTGRESFVYPDVISSFAILSRTIDGLKGVLEKNLPEGHEKKQGGELTPLETAQANLHWEPFDQFRASAIALHDALDAVYKNNNTPTSERLKELTRNIVAHCGEELEKDGQRLPETFTLGHVISGRGEREKARQLDGVLLEVARERTNLDRAVDDAQFTLQGSQEEILETLHTHLQAIKTATPKLSNALVKLSPREKEDIRRATTEYTRQCTLSPEPNLRKLDLIATLPLWSHGIQGLDVAVENMRTGQTGAITSAQAEGLKLVSSEPWEASNRLRAPVRTLSAILNALNENGKYDEILTLANEITGRCWRVQPAIGLNPEVAANIKTTAEALVNQQTEAGKTWSAGVTQEKNSPPTRG